MTSNSNNKITCKEAHEKGICDYYDGVEYHRHPVDWNSVCIEMWQEGWKEAQHVDSRTIEFEEWSGENDEYNGHDM